MNTYEVKGGISVFATGGHQKKGPFGKTGFSKIEKNTIFQISIRSPNRDFEKTPFFSSNLPNGPVSSSSLLTNRSFSGLSWEFSKFSFLTSNSSEIERNE